MRWLRCFASIAIASLNPGILQSQSIAQRLHSEEVNGGGAKPVGVHPQCDKVRDILDSAIIASGDRGLLSNVLSNHGLRTTLSRDPIVAVSGEKRITNISGYSLGYYQGNDGTSYYFEATIGNGIHSRNALCLNATDVGISIRSAGYGDPYKYQTSGGVYYSKYYNPDKGSVIIIGYDGNNRMASFHEGNPSKVVTESRRLK